MAVRLLLLMTLTGLFAAAWNSDSPQAATPSLAAAVRRPDPKSVAVGLQQEWKASQVSQSVVISHEFGQLAVALPESIAPGTYRVVDPQGRVGWVAIPVEDLPSSAVDEPKPFYISQSEAGGWYFIRVEAAPVMAAPQTSGSVLR